MKIDADKILAETIAAFENSGAANIYRACKDKVETEDYAALHPQFLTPTNIKIDADKFNYEMLRWQGVFERWGNDHIHLPRFGAALVNKDGFLDDNDPINGSLMAWNKSNPTEPLLETDCRKSTALMQISSLLPIRSLDGHWCRSNILKWGKDAMFVPHVDTIVPSMWIRLWATLSPNVVVRYAKDGELVAAEYEVGRVYVIDTSVVHDAYATDDNVYQLFLSVMPSATNLLKTICHP